MLFAHQFRRLWRFGLTDQPAPVRITDLSGSWRRIIGSLYFLVRPRLTLKRWLKLEEQAFWKEELRQHRKGGYSPVRRPTIRDGWIFDGRGKRIYKIYRGYLFAVAADVEAPNYSREGKAK